MGLPQINPLPKHDIMIPSTQQKIQFRPFLVKEQKILLMALETQDQTQILNAITDIIQDCILAPINIKTLTTFDVEYLFIQIRSKSVGERAVIQIQCPHCDEPHTISIQLDAIKVDMPQPSTKMIKLTDKYTLKMRYPAYQFMLNSDVIKNETSLTEKMYEMVIGCMDSLQTDDISLKFDDEPKQEVDRFLETLTPDQMKLLIEFVQALPKIQHLIKYKCSKCSKENQRLLEGISDFF